MIRKEIALGQDRTQVILKARDHNEFHFSQMPREKEKGSVTALELVNTGSGLDKTVYKRLAKWKKSSGRHIWGTAGLKIYMV